MTGSRTRPLVRRRTRRSVVVYLLLVVVPTVVITVLLTSSGDGEDGTTSSTVDVADHPLARLLLAVAVVVAACKALGAVAQRLGQPAVIGEITAGIVLGPSLLGALWPAGATALIPDVVLPELNVLAQVGLVLFVFLTGLELNTALLRGRGQVAVVVSHVSIAVPFLFGVLLAAVAYARFAPDGVGYLAFALFFGVSMSVTALPVLMRILQDLGMFRSEVGVVALTCAVIDDVTAWTLLALVVALVTSSSMVGLFLTVALMGLFVLVLLVVVRPLLVRVVARAKPSNPLSVAPMMLVAVLLCAMCTEWIGVHAMFGAFLFGVVFPRGNVVARWLHDKAGGLTTALLLPLFFAYSGLRTDIGLVGDDLGLWLWCALILAVAVLGKVVGSAIAARAVGETWNRSFQVGALMNCRGLTELVVLNVGMDIGVLSQTTFTMFVIMALVSTAMSGPVVTWLVRRARVGTGPAEGIRSDRP